MIVKNNPPKLLDQLAQAVRVRNYSLRTEQAYAMWIKQYIRFHKLTHPQEMGEELLLAGLMYGSGLRLMEALRLRVKDLDFSYI